MTPLDKKRTVRSVLTACVGMAALIAGVAIPLPEEAPKAPPPPDVETHVDIANEAVCWVASSPHGVAISCLRSAPGEFGP